MEFEIVLIVLLLLAVVVGGILGFIAFFQLRGLRDLPARIGVLERELTEMRGELARRSPPGEAPRPGPWEMPSAAGAPPAEAEPETVPEAPATAAQQLEPAVAARAAEPQESIPAPPAPQPPPSPARPRKDLETTFGAMWAVWVGGVALALGGIFLVKYSIDQGWLGPAARVTIGLLFGAGLAAAGEWTRRRGQAYSVAGFEQANVPAILTGAGIVAAFASIYAAYELYGFVGPAFAFVALGIVAVAGLFSALLHGHLLAALGLLASYAVPFLVSTDEPNPLALALYVLAVSASAFGVARLQLWRWLAIAAAGGLILFGIVMLAIAGDGDRLVLFTYIFASWALVFYIFVASLYPQDPQHGVAADREATGLLAAVLLLLAGAILFRRYDFFSVAALIGAVVVPMTAAVYYCAARYVVLAVLVVVVPGYLAWSVPIDQVMNFADDIGSTHGISTPMLEDLRAKADAAFVFTGIALALAAAGLGAYGTLRSASRALLAVGGTALPLLILTVAWIRLEHFSSSLVFGVIALALGTAIGGFANRLYFRLDATAPAREEAIAAWAVATIAAFSLALAFLLERGAFTVALALVVPATAFVYVRRPVAALRPVAAFVAVLWVLRVAWDPRIVGDDLGTVPVLNWLTYGYGVPAAGFAYAAYLFGTVRRDLWLEILEGIALVTAVAAAALVGLHAIDPKEVFTAVDTLAEAALYCMVATGASLALARMQRSAASRPMGAAIPIFAGLGMAIAVALLVIAFNPYFSRETIGPALILNKLAFGYLAPAVLYAGLALAVRIPPWRAAAAGFACVLTALWITLTIRHGFHPDGLRVGPTTDAELYTYSAVWLVVAIAVLAAGIVTGYRPVRLLSGLILIGVVAKVFLIDMSSLTGALRALSFIGLGLVLIGIGLVYQRLLRQPPEPDPVAT